MSWSLTACPPTPWRSIVWLALAACAAITGARCAGCDEPAEVSAPSLAWDGETYAIAWAEAEPSGIAVHAHRLAPGGEIAEVSARGTEPIFRARELRGSPEIVAGKDGFVVVVLPQDYIPRAIPLDRHGSVSGPPQPLPGCTGRHACFDLCRGAVTTPGGAYAVAYLATDTPLDSLHLVFLDREGRPGHDTMVGFGVSWRPCALAAAGDRLAVAWGELSPAADAVRIGVSVRSARDGEAIGGDVWLPGARSSVLALVAHGGDWAVLYQDVAGRLQVAVVNPAVGVRESITLPADIDARSADLGVNRRGLFVTWLAGGKTHVAGVGTGVHRAVRSRSTAVGTRAVGHDDRCAVTWSESGGRRVHLATSRPCP